MSIPAVSILAIMVSMSVMGGVDVGRVVRVIRVGRVIRLWVGTLFSIVSCNFVGGGG